MLFTFGNQDLRNWFDSCIDLCILGADRMSDLPSDSLWFVFSISISPSWLFAEASLGDTLQRMNAVRSKLTSNMRLWRSSAPHSLFICIYDSVLCRESTASWHWETLRRSDNKPSTPNAPTLFIWILKSRSGILEVVQKYPDILGLE